MLKNRTTSPVVQTFIDCIRDVAGRLAAQLYSVNENIFDISERFDAPGIAKRKTNKRAQELRHYWISSN
jgi:hypothetical protein